MTRRQDRVQELLRGLAGTFIQRNSDDSSLITVTAIDVSPDLAEATVYLTVFPEDRERAAMNFLERHAREFKEYVKDNCRLKRVPHFTFAIDEGERNRQRIDSLVNESDPEESE